MKIQPKTTHKWCACGVKAEEKIDKWKKMDKMKRKELMTVFQ